MTPVPPVIKDPLPPEFSRLVRLDDVRKGTVAVTVTASVAERDALAQRLQVTEITALEADLKVSRLSDGVFEVTGRFEAEITFIGEHADEALDFTVSEAVEEIFATETGWKQLEEKSLDDDVDAELLTVEQIDLGEVVAQNLSLALDPALLESGALEEGAVTYTAGGNGDSVSDNPFAALAALRARGNQGGDSSVN